MHKGLFRLWPFIPVHDILERDQNLGWIRRTWAARVAVHLDLDIDKQRVLSIEH